MGSAIAIAHGKNDDVASAIRTKAAWRDLSARGSGTESYRRRLPAGTSVWTWVSSDRLPRGTYVASDRRSSVFGESYPGDLLAEFERGQSRGEAKITRFLLVHETGACDDRPTHIVTPCDHARRSDGVYCVTLPDGSELLVTDPRWR